MSTQAVPDIPEYLNALNDQQLKAALHFLGPILILAGAGSGKTRVLTHRIAHLIQHYNVPPASILAVTFTNKAAEEMKTRLRALLGDKGDRIWASTFHSLGLRILRRHAAKLGYTSDFVVYDQQDSKALIKELIKELKIDDAKFPVQLFQRAIESAKNKFVSPEKFSESFSNYSDSIVGNLYDRYQRILLQNNAMDFGDLLYNMLRLFKQEKEIARSYQEQFQFVLVDEFQDTNDIQYNLIRIFAAPQNNLLAVGDDDQSIYAFRGATIENILNFEKDFKDAVVVPLEQNYRSTQTILDASNSVISLNKERRSKTLWTNGEAGQAIGGYVGFDENDEASFIVREIENHHRNGARLKDIAIFYRTNAQSRAIEDALMAHKIQYRIYGGLKFYDRKEIKDILGYLKLIVNESDNQSFMRCVNTPPRGLGAKSVEAVRQYAADNSISMMDAARALAPQSKALGVFVSLMEELRERSSKDPLHELIAQTVEKSGYGPKLKSLKDVTAQSRLENLKELEAVAVTMTYVADSPAEDLRLFLDRVSLTSGEELPVEEAHDKEDGKEKQQKEPPDTVSLMTLHLAKGLEFPVVFLTGMEEGLLPHYRSLESEFEISEERRLCYVGMTRAMENLYLSRAERRGMFSSGGGYGSQMGNGRQPSRFLFDVPESCFNDDAKHIASHTGGYGAVHYEYADELTYEDVKALQQKQSNLKRSRKTSSKPATITTADALHPEQGMSDDEFSHYEQARLQDLSLGTKVVHRTFGEGVVEEIKEVDGDDPGKTRIIVDFENFELPKKLVFRHAKLALG